MCKQFSFLFCICLICSSQSLFAQKLLALHHAGAASFYTSLDGAYNAAVNGDTIYLPGGNISGITLQKSLTLIGVGHHPDSTSATGTTILSYLSIYGTASNSFITGIYFTQNVVSHDNVVGLHITRCYFAQGIRQSSGQIEGWIVSESFIGSSPGPYYYSIYTPNGINNSFISNNVIGNGANSFQSTEISNNVFLNGPILSTNCLIRNNIFTQDYQSSTSNCQWYNNLNAGVNGGPNGNGNTGSGNYFDNAPYTSVFVNYNGSNTFYQNDFHVVNSAYLGNDGTPVGIYGGAFPWKEGSLPSNPHIRAKTINSTTNPDGTLHINVTVKAQGN